MTDIMSATDLATRVAEHEAQLATRIARITAGLEAPPLQGCYMVLDPMHLVRLREKIAKYSRRAVKHGGMPLALWEAPEASWVDRARPDGTAARIRVRQVALLGDVPDTGDWQYAAMLTHRESATIITRTGLASVDDAVLAQYRARGPVCDHCSERRRRNETYVIRHRLTGEVVQVGSSCLAEYCSGSPDAALYVFDLHRSLTEEIRQHAKLDDAVQAEEGQPIASAIASLLGGDDTLAAALLAEATRVLLPSLVEERRVEIMRLAGESTVWDASIARLPERLHNAMVLVAEGFVSYQNRRELSALVAWYRAEVDRLTRERLAADTLLQMNMLGVATLPTTALELAALLADPVACANARKLLAALNPAAPVIPAAPAAPGARTGRIFWRGRGVTRTDTIGVCTCGCARRCASPVWVEVSKLSNPGQDLTPGRTVSF